METNTHGKRRVVLENHFVYDTKYHSQYVIRTLIHITFYIVVGIWIDVVHCMAINSL